MAVLPASVVLLLIMALVIATSLSRNFQAEALERVSNAINVVESLQTQVILHRRETELMNCLQQYLVSTPQGLPVVG